MAGTFSVVVPCRDSSRWLGRTLASVAAQTRPADELIVVDDGSTDDSAAIARDAGATVVASGGVGGAAARNRGAAAATGEWLAFLDADDLWYPPKLARVADLADRSPATGVGVLHHFDHVSADDADEVRPRPADPAAPAREPAAALPAAAFVRWYAASTVFPGMTACVVRRSAWHAVGGMDERQTRRHDIELWLRLLTGVPGATWAYDPRAGSAYRANRAGNLSTGDLPGRERFHLRAVARHAQGLRELDSASARRVVTRAAARCLGSALTDGDAEDRRRAAELAGPHLRGWRRALATLTRRAPALLAAPVRLRRLVRGTPSPFSPE